MEKYYLTIKATSTPNDLIFSKAGHIANSKRNYLSSTNLNKLLFVSHNIKKIKKIEI